MLQSIRGLTPPARQDTPISPDPIRGALPPAPAYTPAVTDPGGTEAVGRPRARIAWLFALLAAPAAGCFSAYNPGYVPYVVPPGRIVQEHAKPRGPGYFRDFDPKARKLEVTPA